MVKTKVRKHYSVIIIVINTEYSIVYIVINTVYSIVIIIVILTAHSARCLESL